MTLHHEEAQDLFVVSVSPASSDLLPFIAEGALALTVPTRNRSARAMERTFLGISHPVAAAISDSLWRSGHFQSLAAGDELRVYCVAAVSQTSGEIGVLCSNSEPTRPDLPEELVAAARDLVGRYRAVTARQEAERALEESRTGELIEAAPSDAREKLRKSLETGLALSVRVPPVLDARAIVHLFPPGVVLRVRGARSGDANIIKHILAIPDGRSPPPRDGLYHVTTTGGGHQQYALVTWRPHRGDTPYPEVRAAIERRIPKAMAKPRASTAVRPTHPGHPVADIVSEVSSSPDVDGGLDWEEIRFAFDFPDEVAQSVKGRLAASGLEAIGWYAPWHSHAEGVWGIYIDAVALDELACSLSEDLEQSAYRRRDEALASQLAFDLVYRHERFHAIFEAVLSWSELQALRGVYQRYSQAVYAKVRDTDECLEEALANYWSWAWFQQELTGNSRLEALSDEQRLGIAEVVASHLSMAPPGYRRWREGSEPLIWRMLATQGIESRARLPAAGIPLPLEALLLQRLPFELLPEDIPLRFIGSGRIASAILSRPSTMRLPSRAELRQVITKHFRYALVPGGGKGSHEKYRSVDGRRSFSVPTTDPVSKDVFGKFLRHFDVSKADYMLITGRVPSTV